MLPRAVAVLGLLACALAALWQPGPPAPQGAEAPRNAFSAARAMVHVRAIAAAPHPTGSPAHAQVRDYIVGELARLGIATEIQRATSAAEYDDPAAARYRVAARVQNIVARLPGTQAGGAVLLMAHYDSVAAGPGASDDGAGVAALLETARALLHDAPRTRDVVLLFSDAEELGMLGARAYFEAAPAIAVALNFEARGTEGPVMMFETSWGNAGLVRALIDAVPEARTSSLIVAASSLLPNATDFGLARARGIAGLNFAHIEGINRYHTALDDSDHLALSTLQHHGAYALGLARRFASGAIPAPSEDAVFFSLGGPLIAYPAAASLPLALAVAIAWLVVVWRARLRRGHVVAASGLWLAVALVAAIAAAAIAWLASATHDEFRRVGDTYDHGTYAAAVALACLAIDAAIARVVLRRSTASELVAGAALIWAVLAIAVAIAVPGASYVFTWPALGAVLGLAVLPREPTAKRLAISLVISVAPIALIVAPLIPILFVGLSLMMAPGVALVIALTLGLLAPHIALVASRRGVLLLGSLVAVVLAFASWPRAATRDAPRQNSLLYALDSDAPSAIWASSDDAVDDWTRRALGPSPTFGPLPAYLPAWSRALWQAPAPVARLAAPTLEVLHDSGVGPAREVRVRVASSRGARSIALVVEGAPVVAYRVDGVTAAHAHPDAPWTIWLEGGGAWELALTLGTGDQVMLRAVDRSDDLPAPLPARPATMIPAASLDMEMWSHATYVSRAFVLSSRYKPSPAAAR